MENNNVDTNAIIKVIGVGGGGGNAVNTMIESGLAGVEFIAANTDIQALTSNLSPLKVQLGRELTKGLGAGANPSTGQDAALEDKAIIQEILTGADMVFVTAGMGGGTGTGAAPVIAQVARELGALTVGVVTKPFTFEGKRRRLYADKGIDELKSCVDTLITIPNQRLLSIAPPNMSMLDGFKLADEVLLNAVKGISDIINVPGRVNVDFADVKTTMMDMGMALMGIGSSNGSNRATEAARAAINSPLLEDIDIQGATGVLINITGSSEMTLHEISEASTLIQEAAHEEANIIFGAVIDESMGEEIRVTVIATGFDKAAQIQEEPQKYFANHQVQPPPIENTAQPQDHPHHNSGQGSGYGQEQQTPYGRSWSEPVSTSAPSRESFYNGSPNQDFYQQQRRSQGDPQAPARTGIVSTPQNPQGRASNGYQQQPQHSQREQGRSDRPITHTGQQRQQPEGRVPQGQSWRQPQERGYSYEPPFRRESPYHRQQEPSQNQAPQQQPPPRQYATPQQEAPNRAPQSPRQQDQSPRDMAGRAQGRNGEDIVKAIESQNEAAAKQPNKEFESLTEITFQMAQDNPNLKQTGQPQSNGTQQHSGGQERSINGACAGQSPHQQDEETQQAIKLAEELSKVKLDPDGDDFETPTFLRRKEEKAP